MTAIHAVDASASRDAAVEAVLRPALPDIDADGGSPSDGLILGPFLRPHLHGLHPFLVEIDLNSAVDVVGILPEGSQILRWHRRTGSPQVLASYDGCLVVVRSWKRSSDVWVSGADKERVTRLAAELKQKVPAPPRERAVRVTFWHMVKHGWHRSRDIEVPTWADVAHLYPATVRAAMERLTAYRPNDDGAGGRLLLWHGPPGTGKTTAVRALFDAWRDWATAHVVSDPEQLLNSGDYMAQVLLDPDDEDDDTAPWRLVVVEDAEELLRRDARAQVGSALGRLLNTADGLLGQGSKAMILLTTNEPIGEMHPALLRPGRCLARIEFPALSAAEAGQLLNEPVHAPATLAEVMERRGALRRMQTVAERQRPGLYL